MAASDNDGDEDSVPSFDAERYRVTEPKGDKKDVIAWKLAVRNAMLQYEYQAKRFLNTHAFIFQCPWVLIYGQLTTL